MLWKLLLIYIRHENMCEQKVGPVFYLKSEKGFKKEILN